MKQIEIDDESELAELGELENQSYNGDSKSEEYDYYNIEQTEEQKEQNRSGTYESFNLLETNENGRFNKFELENPRKMESNCANLKCKDNIQNLYQMQEKYTLLEKSYFNLENSRAEKYQELEEILKKKEEEKKHLESIHNVYEKFDLKNSDLFKLRGLETKIIKSLEVIKERKQIILAQSNLKSTNSRTCVICYEREIKVLLKPCNHLCACIQCSNKIEDCPMCREKIISKEIVKLP